MTWSDPVVETVLPGVHRAPVPLPHDGLRAINTYLIEDGDGVTMIDAGWDSPLAREAVDAGLAAAGAEIGDVRRILVTHIHYDHVGQATELVRAGAGGYWLGTHETDSFKSVVDDPYAAWRERLAQLRRHGGAELADNREVEPPSLEPVDWDEPIHWAEDGDRYDGGSEPIHAIHTPGHTNGHLCFEHEGRRVLFSGDHVLPHITPSIGFESITNRMALADFLSSLARVRTMDVDLVLPAHGEPFTDLAGRVDELTAHHDTRLAHCVAAIGPGGTADAYQVAGRLGWTRRETPFEQLDLFNKVLATWETAAHLELLAARGELTRDDDGPTITFTAPSPDATG
ncbi:MBL fold metallo-hydrolase [Euzebya sp.]|uniref:MBL fold metallo-hydrolase n=1 Tax=Euzebya sp. TaxID=1971409 RepID=UPI0035140EAB